MSEEFEAHRARLVAHAYRMLGEIGRAEELVQEAWVRWAAHAAQVQHPGAWLTRTVTRLCLNELGSARARREVWLPDLAAAEQVDPAARAEEISLAFLLMLQRLTPAERAVLLLHQVFDFSHAEIAETLGRTPAASRQLLRRARQHLRVEQPRPASPREHRRLLEAFLQAASTGDLSALLALLAPDVTLTVDAPDGARFGGARALGRPLVGGARVAGFISQITPRGVEGQAAELCTLNGQDAVVLRRDGEATAAVMLHTADGRIEAIYVQADPRRLVGL